MTNTVELLGRLGLRCVSAGTEQRESHHRRALKDQDLAGGCLQHCNHGQRRHFYLLLAAIVLTGIFFRFYNLDLQLYWNDEVFTSLRVAGYQVSEIEDELRDGPIVSVADMQKYQTLGPNRTVKDTVKGLAVEEPQHAPLYFVLARYWVTCFGDSIASIRGFSAFLSLLALPCMFWLCSELFGEPRISWVATAIVAISPVHVVFAQEARPYSLFILIVLLSSVTLLRAIRVPTILNWAIYCVLVATGLYTQLFFGAVAIGHAVYVLTVSRFRASRVSIYYVVASFAALLTFVPWVRVILSADRTEGVDWTNDYQSIADSIIRWSGIVSRTFLDLGIGPDDSLGTKLSVLPFVALILLLIVYSIFFLIHRAPLRQWLFVVALIASVALPLFLLDITLNRRYGTTRYILSTSIGLQLSMAYLLSENANVLAVNFRRRRVWQVVAIIVILGGFISCAVRSGGEMWWNKVPDNYGDYPQIARVVNQASQPVIYSYGHWRLAQMICHRLHRNVRLQLLSDDRVPQLSIPINECFLFNPSADTRSRVEQSYDVRVERSHGTLWKVVQN